MNSKVEHSVGIFKLRYPLPSETFITSQSKALTRYEPLVLARKNCGTTSLPVLDTSDNDPAGIRQGWYAFTRSPAYFLSDRRVRALTLIHAHSGPDGVYALPLVQRLAVPLVVTFHGQDATSRSWPLFRALFGVTVAIYCRYLHRLIKDSSAIIAVSDFVQSCLMARGFPKEKIHKLSIGVDTERFCPLPIPAGSINERYILNVARHVPVKGVDTTLRAFALIAREHSSVQLLQVGAGPLTKSLQQLACVLGVSDRVRFLGPLTHHEVLPLMQSAEVVVLSSRTDHTGAREALGMVLNEASACGVALAATCSGGIPEAVLHGKTGFLSPEEDERSLAENLARLLADEELRRTLGRHGREYVCEKFCLRKQTAQLEYLYDCVIEEQAVASGGNRLRL